MNLFDGLRGYEAVMLVLGALLFLVLLAALVALIVRRQPYGKLPLFFGISIVMMGYSSIQHLQFQSGVVTIDKTITNLQANPTDTKLRQDLSKKVKDLSSRQVTDPAALTTLARAQFALGNHAAAEATLKKAVTKAPDLPQAQELKKRIGIDQSLTSLTAQVAQHSGDTAARQKLEKAVDEAAHLQIASPVLLSHVASAQAAVGNQAKASSYADRALAINPNLAAARDIKNRAGSASPQP